MLFRSGFTGQSHSRKIVMLGLCLMVALSNSLTLFSPTLAAASVENPTPNLSLALAAQDGQTSADGIWSFVEETAVAIVGQRQIVPKQYRTVRLNESGLAEVLQRAPREFSEAAKSQRVTLALPMPDGDFITFRIEESPVMEAALAEKFPAIKTYRGRGDDDPTLSVRIDSTPAGFHALIFSERGTVYIDPYQKNDTTNYVTYYKADYQKEADDFQCHFSEANLVPNRAAIPALPAAANGTQLRTYRLACAATGEYTAFHGGTVAAGLAAIVTSVNRVNQIYERDLAVRMVLVANNNLIVYTNPATDPYSNNSGSTMLGQNQTNLDSVIGDANYDMGHVFSTGGGGVAFLGVICETGFKARGVTGLPAPVGDPFDIDFVAHEMGHQFGGNHTFNGTTGNCGGGNRAASAAYEPGSGSTIMAYAGICGSQNLQPNSDDHFHIKSLEEILAYLGTTSCAATTNTGNTIPTVSSPATFTIPKSTPFTLTATASDGDGDSLTYCWEEYDLGLSSPPDTDSDGQARPIFRSFSPTANPTRTFPKLSDILNNTQTIGERLPTISRTMNFQVTVRDNRSSGGAIKTSTTQVVVSGTSGPFLVTSPNTNVSWGTLSSQTVTWDVANTANAPVNAANVKITLSTDGGNTFPLTLAASTPNDGSESITVPNNPTTTARIKVEAVGNVFFDVSNANFTIFDASGCSFGINPTSQNVAAGGGSGSVTVTAGSGCPWTAVSNATFISVTSGASGSGNGTVNFSVASNTGPARSGTITIAGQTFTVNQADGCSYAINPTSQNFTASGGNGSLTVTAGTGCQWTAVSNDGFITVTSGASGSGNDTVSYSVAANSGGTRTGTITVAGQTFTVNQEALIVCTFDLSPTSAVFAQNGGNSGVNVIAPAGCAWTAASNASFITITSEASGSGNGLVAYSVSANTTTVVRSGTLTIAGQTFIVTQAASSCISSISPATRSMPANGGTNGVSVSAATTCNWTSQSTVPWITITTGGSGPGAKTLKYSVSPNPQTTQRIGVIIIGSKLHTVTQAGVTCSYSISPASQNISASGGGGTIDVTAQAGCQWTAVSNDGFITVTSGASGSGNDTVSYSVAANSGGTRTGTITVAGKTFAVTQAGVGGCTYSISPTSQSVAAGGGSGAVNVTADSGCGWTAVSNNAFIVITSGSSGSGNGTVAFTVAVNSGAARAGTITIAGQTFTVNQAGSSISCTFSLSPLSASFRKAGGTGSFSVKTQSGCPWTAVSNVSWITILSGASGTGNGTVTYLVDPNTTPSQRTGTITAGGKTFTIKQSTL